MFDILSWNIQQGGGSRIFKITKKISDLRPEVLALSEFRNNNSGIKLRTELLRLGYRYQVASHAGPNQNTAFIASRYPCSSILFPGCDPEYDHNVVCAIFPAFRLYSVYFPHKKKHRLFEFLTEEELSQEAPAIIAGDYNSGRNGIDQRGDSFWYSEYFDVFEKKGYRDAFRELNGDLRDYSWYSHQGNGYRYDHTYISTALVPFIKNCHYLHEWREIGLSDHSPMLLTLTI